MNLLLSKVSIGLKRAIKLTLLTITLSLVTAPTLLAQATSSGTPCPVNQCPGSVADPVAAAWASEAYWVMGDIVFQLANTDLGLMAPLLYIFSALAGMIAMVMGAPPRNYVWFFLGPAIYSWLLFTPHQVQGVAWEVGGVRNDQAQVWRRAEVGLLNSNAVIRQGTSVSKTNGPSGLIEVPMPFVWFDEVVTGLVQPLMQWTGIFHQRSNPSADSNTPENPNPEQDVAWSILSNSKWPMLENITGATFQNEDLREAFVTFMASECGDVVTKHINAAAFTNAAQSRGRFVPEDVFTGNSKNTLKGELYSQYIPVPESVFSYVDSDAPSGSGGNTIRTFSSQNIGRFPLQGRVKNIDCLHYLFVIIEGARFQTGHIYNQVIREGTDYDVSDSTVLYDFLYGWDFGEKISAVKQEHFIQNMIFLHMFKNEMALAPSPVTVRYASAAQIRNYAETYTKKAGSKNKYGEIYTWAKLMPYMQGMMMYIIIIAYPFVCIMMILPGFHKIFFSWMGFYAWIKSWDLGFAIVMSLERSVWGIIGNGKDSAEMNKRILDISDIQSLDVTCTLSGAADSAVGCPIPRVNGTNMNLDDAIELFDEVMSLSSAMDYDLSNTFYIYLMSALYFAVPAVTGQILLGARSGASSFVNSSIGGVSQAGGQNAAAGYGADVNVLGSNNMASVGQAATAKSLRGSGAAAGFLQRSYGSQMAGAQQEMAAAAFGHNSQQLGSADSVAASQAGSLKGAIANAHAKGVGALSSLNAGVDAAYDKKQGWRGKGLSGGKGGSANTVSASPSGTGDTQVANGGGADGSPGDLRTDTSRSGFSASGFSIAEAMHSYGQNAANKEVDDAYAGQSAAFKQAQAGLGVKGFQASQTAKGMGIMSGRYGEASQFAAQSAAWKARRNFSRQIQGSTGAVGVFGGAFSAGEKPMGHIGMSGMGMLGSDNSQHFHGFGSAWGGMVADQSSGLINGSDGRLQFSAGTESQGDGLYNKHNPAGHVTVGSANAAKSVANGVTKVVGGSD